VLFLLFLYFKKIAPELLHLCFLI